MVEKNLPIPHKFVCLSNVEVPVERIALMNNWQGWWSKIELFRPGLFEGRVLFLDLDLLVMKDLTPMIEYPASFVIADKIVGDGLIRPGEVTNYQSCTMSWDADCSESVQIWTRFKPEEHMARYRGDQDYIGELLPNLAKYPVHWVTKLRFCPGKGIKPDKRAIIINCMPYKNDKAAAKFPWVKALWI